MSRVTAIALLLLVGQALADTNYSFHWRLNFETGSNDDNFTLSAASNSVGNLVLPLSRETYLQYSETTNIFRISTAKQFGLTNGYVWAGALQSDSVGTRSLRMKMDTGAGDYMKWLFGAAQNLSVGFYFQTDLASQSPGEGYFDVVYVERPWSADGNMTACALFHSVDNPYWAAHNNSNNVTLTGSRIYGPSLSALQWVTMRVTQTNLTVAVYDPVTRTQWGTNSTLGFGTSSANWTGLRFLAWRRDIPQVGKSTWIDSVVLNTNAAFPLLPWEFGPDTPAFTWPTNTMTSLGFTEVSNAVHRATNGCTIILPAGTTNWAASLVVSNKAISIYGAGATQTIITNTQTGATGMGEKETIILYATTNGVTRLAGIGFDGNRTNNLVLVRAVPGNVWAPFHIHSCGFSHARFVALSFKAMLAGLVERCTFRNNDIALTTYADDHPTWSWATNLTLGTTNSIYTERCTFINDEAFIGDGNISVVTARGRGSRDVFRFNTWTNTYNQKFLPIYDVHGNVGTFSSGTVQAECYSNIFVSLTGSDQKPTDLRGGTTPIFGNQFIGPTMRTQFTAREEDEPVYAMAGITNYPGVDQHWLYSWGNTVNGSPLTETLELFYETDSKYLLEGTNVFWNPMPDYTPLGEHPLTAFPAAPAAPVHNIGTLRAVNLIQRQ